MVRNETPSKHWSTVHEIDLAIRWTVTFAPLVFLVLMLVCGFPSPRMTMAFFCLYVACVLIRLGYLSKKIKKAKKWQVDPNARLIEERVPEPPGFQFRLWHVAVVVAIYALLFAYDRYLHDAFRNEREITSRL